MGNFSTHTDTSYKMKHGRGICEECLCLKVFTAQLNAKGWDALWLIVASWNWHLQSELLIIPDSTHISNFLNAESTAIQRTVMSYSFSLNPAIETVL